MSVEADLDEALARRAPRCAICLALCALVFHCLAFAGNLNVAWTVKDFGSAADGWSSVGLGFAGSLSTDLNGRLLDTSAAMMQAASALEELHDALGALAENASDEGAGASLAELPEGAAPPADFAVDFPLLADRLERLMDLVRPVLLQVQEWLVSFGPELSKGASDLSFALDAVQKILDTAVSHLHAIGGNGSAEAQEVLLRDAFNLFDVSNTGTITREDLKNVSSMYGVSALGGSKADTLIDKYEHGGDSEPGVSPEEFGLLVDDEDVPGVLSLVMRTYARRLARISKQMSAARTRSDVAESVAQYVAQVSVENNATKIRSVLGPLARGSLPLELAADVLAHLAIEADSPEKLTTVDVGAVVVGAMATQSAERVAEAADLLSNASYWAAQGFDPDVQPSCVEKVAKWIAGAKGGRPASELWLSKLVGGHRSRGKLPADHTGSTWPDGPADASGELDVDGGDEGAFLQCPGVVVPAACAAPGAAGGERAALGCREEGEEAALLQSHLHRPAGRPQPQRGPAPARQAVGPGEEEASSRPGAPGQRQSQQDRLCTAAVRRVRDTRRGAEASVALQRARRSSRWRRLAQSGHPLAALSGAVGVANPDAARATGGGGEARPESLEFAAELARRAGEQAKVYEGLCFDYSAASSGAVESAAKIVEGMMRRFSSFLKMVEKYASPRAVRRLEDVLNRTVKDLRSKNFSGVVLLEESAAEGNASFDYAALADFITSLNSALPSWIDALKEARVEVLSVSATMESLFGVVRTKAPPIFELVAKYFVLAVSAYFVVFLVLTLVNLAYALWASRLCEGDVDRAAGEGLPDRLRSRCCISCCFFCDDHEGCFWSAIVLMEVLWLVLFFTTFAMLVIFGVRAFVGAGCKPIYLIGDQDVCGDRLHVVGAFLQNHSWAFGDHASLDLPSSCSDQKLLVCQMIREKLYSSMLAAVLGNVLAAAVTWLLIVESAQLHERRHRSTLLLSVIEGKPED